MVRNFSVAEPLKLRIVTKSSYAYRENFDLADKVVDDLEVGGVGLDVCKALADA